MGNTNTDQGQEANTETSPNRELIEGQLLDPGGVVVSQFLPLYNRESSPYKMRTLGSPDLVGGAQSVGTELDIYGERDPDLIHQQEFRGGYSRQHISPFCLLKKQNQTKNKPPKFPFRAYSVQNFKTDISFSLSLPLFKRKPIA